MAFLFDTDAVSEALKRRPEPAYIEWLARVPRDEQYASAVTIGEMYRRACTAICTRNSARRIH